MHVQVPPHCVDLRPLGPRGGRRCFPKPRSPRPPRWPPPPERSSPASPGFRPSSSGSSSPYTRGEQRRSSSGVTPHSLQSHFAAYMCVSSDRRRESGASCSLAHPFKSDLSWDLVQVKWYTDIWKRCVEATPVIPSALPQTNLHPQRKSWFGDSLVIVVRYKVPLRCHTTVHHIVSQQRRRFCSLNL